MIGFSPIAPTGALILEAIDRMPSITFNLHWYSYRQQERPAMIAAQCPTTGPLRDRPTDKGPTCIALRAFERTLCAVAPDRVQPICFCLFGSRNPHDQCGCGRSGRLSTSTSNEAVALLPQGSSLLPPILRERLETPGREPSAPAWLESWPSGLPEWPTRPAASTFAVALWLHICWRPGDLGSYGGPAIAAVGPGLTTGFPRRQCPMRSITAFLKAKLLAGAGR